VLLASVARSSDAATYSLPISEEPVSHSYETTFDFGFFFSRIDSVVISIAIPAPFKNYVRHSDTSWTFSSIETAFYDLRSPPKQIPDRPPYVWLSPGEVAGDGIRGNFDFAFQSNLEASTAPSSFFDGFTTIDPTTLLPRHTPWPEFLYFGQGRVVAYRKDTTYYSSGFGSIPNAIDSYSVYRDFASLTLTITGSAVPEPSSASGCWVAIAAVTALYRWR
jgi:hypothetical protein